MYLIWLSIIEIDVWQGNGNEILKIQITIKLVTNKITQILKTKAQLTRQRNKQSNTV